MAQHAILRFEKHKGNPARPLEAHHERQKEQYASNPDIDTSRSKYNFHIVKPEGRYYHFIASTGFYVCNSNGVLLPEFMFFLMISGYVVNGLNQYMKGDNSPSISKDNIENWLYPVPPIGEQQTICAKLKTVFTLVENVEKSLN